MTNSDCPHRFENLLEALRAERGEYQSHFQCLEAQVAELQEELRKERTANLNGSTIAGRNTSEPTLLGASPPLRASSWRGNQETIITVKSELGANPNDGAFEVLPERSIETLSDKLSSKTESEDVTAVRKSEGLGSIKRRASGKSLDYRSCRSFLKSLVRSNKFEATFAVLICLSAVVMAMEAEYHGQIVAFELTYPDRNNETDQVWPWADFTLNVLGMSFGFLFTVEISLKLVGIGLQFFRDAWNWTDLIAVLFWIIAQLPSSNGIPINPQLFRLMRLGRLLRILKVVRKLNHLDSLFLMVTAIRGSMSVLLWAVVLLGLVQVALALCLNQTLLTYYFNNGSYSLDDRRAVYEYFGSFTRSLFSMFEITLANWPPVARLLAERVSPWFFMIMTMHKLVFGFAIIGVINGVFMQETFKAAALDDSIMVRQNERRLKIHKQKMAMLLKEADVEGEADGKLSREEFKDILRDSQVKLWLSSMELDTSNANALFNLLDKSGDGYLSLGELIKGVLKLKGPAKSMDLLVLMSEQRALAASVDRLRRELRSSVSEVPSRKSQYNEMAEHVFEPQGWTSDGASGEESTPAATPALVDRETTFC